MNDADFDDILSILEKKEYNRANTTMFIDEDDEKEIEWIKESSEEGIEVDPFSKVFLPKFTYIEVPKQEKKELSSEEIEEIIESFKKECAQDTYEYTPRKEKKRSKIIGKIGEYLIGKVRDFYNDEPGAVAIKIFAGMFIAALFTLNVMETSLMKQEEKARNNPTPKKEEYVTKSNTYKSNTVFTQKENGKVTNILDSDIYKEFEEYARSNDLVMNMENFQDFCNNYYENTSSRGGR